MPTLSEIQDNFIATINDGPDALDPSIFAGDPYRVFLGLKAHANTVSHARLISLEETFPRTYEAMGKAAFNKFSRQYCDTAIARALNNNDLGKPFIDFLRHNDATPDIIDLAQIEWLWLESYNAAEITPLNLADLATLDETALLSLNVQAHPSMRNITLSVPLSPALPELADNADTYALLITRPEAMPIFTAIGALEVDLLDAVKKNTTIGNLLAIVAEQDDNTEPLTPIITLINAGALAHIKAPTA